jgi:Core-2/I-Branching enzyme
MFSRDTLLCLVFSFRHTKKRWIKYVYKNGKRTKQTKDDAPHNLRLSKGSTHIVARREFVDFAVNDYRAHDFLQWLQDTHIPDETFFSSLNRNPQLKIPGTYRGKYRIM